MEARITVRKKDTYCGTPCKDFLTNSQIPAYLYISVFVAHLLEFSFHTVSVRLVIRTRGKGGCNFKWIKES
jgi:hypothetical protein